MRTKHTRTRAKSPRHRPGAADFSYRDSIAASTRGGEQALHRLAHRFVTETKRAVMHRQEEIGSQVIGDLPRLLRRRVRSDVGVIRADAENRQIDLAEAAEAFVVCGIAAVEDAALRRLEQVCVEAAMAIVERSRAPVGDFL